MTRYSPILFASFFLLQAMAAPSTFGQAPSSLNEPLDYVFKGQAKSLLAGFTNQGIELAKEENQRQLHANASAISNYINMLAELHSPGRSDADKKALSAKLVDGLSDFKNSMLNIVKITNEVLSRTREGTNRLLSRPDALRAAYTPKWRLESGYDSTELKLVRSAGFRLDPKLVSAPPTNRRATEASQPESADAVSKAVAESGELINTFATVSFLEEHLQNVIDLSTGCIMIVADVVGAPETGGESILYSVLRGTSRAVKGAVPLILALKK